MYRTPLAQSLANEPGKTTEGREDRIAAARQERSKRNAKTVVAGVAAAALLYAGAKIAPEEIVRLDEPAATGQNLEHENQGQNGSLAYHEQPIQVDKNGLPYIEDEPPK